MGLDESHLDRPDNEDLYGILTAIFGLGKRKEESEYLTLLLL